MPGELAIYLNVRSDLCYYTLQYNLQHNEKLRIQMSGYSCGSKNRNAR